MRDKIRVVVSDVETVASTGASGPEFLGQRVRTALASGFGGQNAVAVFRAFGE